MSLSFQAISNPKSEDMQRLAWNIVCPLVKQLKTYHDYSLEVGKLPTTPAPIFVVSETCVSAYLPSLTNHRKHDRRVSQRYSFKSREGELGTFFAHAVSAIFRLSLTHTHNSISIYYPGQKIVTAKIVMRCRYTVRSCDQLELRLDINAACDQSARRKIASLRSQTEIDIA